MKKTSQHKGASRNPAFNKIEFLAEWIDTLASQDRVAVYNRLKSMGEAKYDGGWGLKNLAKPLRRAAYLSKKDTVNADQSAILDAVAALRTDFARLQKVEAEGTFASRAPKPKWPGRKGPNKTEMRASEWLQKYYEDAISSGYSAADLNRDDPRLYVALTNEARQNDPPQKLTDFIPAKNQRLEERREHMAKILGTDVDSAAEFFATARRSVSPSRRGR